MKNREMTVVLLGALAMVLIVAASVAVRHFGSGDETHSPSAPPTTEYVYLDRRCPKWQEGLDMGATDDGLRRFCASGGYVWGDRYK